jgi:hypothetical protein
VKRFIFFHNVLTRRDGRADVTFLTHLAAREKVSAPTQTQALSTLCSSTAMSSAARSQPWRGHQPGSRGGCRLS